MTISSLWRRLGAGLLGLVLATSVISGPAAPPASAAIRTTCSSATPRSFTYVTGRSYTRSDAWCIQSMSKNQWLVWQSDGNLVMYRRTLGVFVRAIWASGTQNRGVRLVAQGDGNIVIYDGVGRAVWALSWTPAGSWESTTKAVPYTYNAKKIPVRLATGEFYKTELVEFNTKPNEIHWRTTRQVPSGGGYHLVLIGR